MVCICVYHHLYLWAIIYNVLKGLLLVTLIRLLKETVGSNTWLLLYVGMVKQIQV